MDHRHPPAQHTAGVKKALHIVQIGIPHRSQQLAKTTARQQRFLHPAFGHAGRRADQGPYSVIGRKPRSQQRQIADTRQDRPGKDPVVPQPHHHQQQAQGRRHGEIRLIDRQRYHQRPQARQHPPAATVKAPHRRHRQKQGEGVLVHAIDIGGTRQGQGQIGTQEPAGQQNTAGGADRK